MAEARHSLDDAEADRGEGVALARARELGIAIGDLEPGPSNAITDVEGVRVGHRTLVSGDGQLVLGRGPVRTGVTVVVPDGVFERPLFCGCHRLNGNGEMTGLEWIRESGRLTTPIGLTNTHSVGVVRDALVAAHVRARGGGLFWSLPVVAETWDGILSDVGGQHVRAEHVEEALAAAAGGLVPEGNVGSGTGMICHEFKGGIGTASRRLGEEGGGYTVGVLVQANHGQRERLVIEGVRVGRAIDQTAVPKPNPPEAAGAGAAAAGGGSIIVIVATDAPLLPHQCTRVAQRAALGVARTGGAGEHFSGDLMLAFATGNDALHPDAYDDFGPREGSVRMLGDAHITPLFEATIEATEEAIVNAMLAAETMRGRDGVVAHELPAEALVEVLGGSGG